MTQRINFDTPVETYLSYREMKAVERERDETGTRHSDGNKGNSAIKRDS